MNKMVLGLFSAALLLAVDGFGASTFQPDPADGYVGDIKIDSSEDVTINSSTATQSTSTGVGVTGNSSIEKRGTGTLTVNGMHSFTGDITIYGGTYAVGTGTTDKGAARNSQLGDPRSERRIVVYTNATLQLARTGVFGAGTATSDVLADLEVRGGTLKLANSSCTCIGNLYLHDAILEYNGGANNWPLLCMTGSYLEFSKSDSTPYILPANGNNCGLFLSRMRPIDIRVPDITGDDAEDVVLGLPFKDVIYDTGNTSGWCVKGVWNCSTNFVKTGAGRLSIANIDNNIVRDIVVSNGVLSVDVGKARIGSDCKATALGNTYDAMRTLVVEKDAELWLNHSDVFGQYFHSPTLGLAIRGGKLKLASQTSNRLGPSVFEDVSVDIPLGAWSAAGRWPGLGLSTAVFRGSTAISLTYAGGYLGVARHVLSDGDITADLGELDVATIVSGGRYSGDPDVTVDVPIQDVSLSWGTYNVGKVLPSGFKKTGAGVLYLKSISSGFTGGLEIRSGVVTMGKVGAVEEPTSSPLGNLMVDRRITVADGGELYFTDTDQLAQLGGDYQATIAVSNGTIRFKSGIGNGFPALDLYDATFAYGDGNSGTWGIFGFRYKVAFDGTRKLSLPAVKNGIISLGYSSDRSEEEGSPKIIHGKTEFCVKDMTGNADVDVDIGLDIQSMPFWNKEKSKHYNERFRCGLLKTGEGTLRLAGKFKCPEETRINAGALIFDGTLAEQESGWGKSVMRVQSGARLGGSGTVDRVVIEEGGGFASAPGQTVALTTGSVTLPDSKNVIIDIACTNDLTNVWSLEVPVVADTGLSDAKFKVLCNGSENLPTGFRASVRVKNGVIYGRISQGGLLIVVE